ncbi:MAG: DUF547 domain-containing protein [Desulfobulbales bacterium]|nr:DUF547 domain-containing protein [Desulfobulbales bacterium]
MPNRKTPPFSLPFVFGLVLSGLVLSGLVLLSSSAYGAPAAKLWARWQHHDPDSQITVDHANWDTIVKSYVDTTHPSGIYRFKYATVTPEDRQTLNNYLRKMQDIKVSELNRDEQKAYWINLYNGLTVDVILDHYPVRSIRAIDISPGFFSNGPWDAKLLKIEGEKLSLNDIEHRILRPIWQDNRIHYAVNCASLGCPNLQPEAFTSQNINRLLEKAAGDFINHTRGVTFSRDKIQVSSIYIWFREDFGDSQEGIIRHLEKYLTPENLEKLKSGQKKMSHHYDWDLNE